MGRLTRTVVTALACGALALTPTTAHAAQATSDSPAHGVAAARPEALGQIHDTQIRDARGVNVTSVTKVSGLERTWQINYSTPSIDSAQTFDGQMAVRVTLPAGYATHPDKHYPVLYLLPGGGSGRVRDWTDESRTQGQAEQITADADLITVTLEGGKVSWYSDWANQSRGDADWLHHHLDEAIPFVDANFRTLASGKHRAIAGLSMGGYGAYHYAMERPEMFSSVSAYSGGVDIESASVRATVAEQLVKSGYQLDSVWGPMVRANTALVEANPSSTQGADKLARIQRDGTRLALYAGTGLGIGKRGAMAIETAVGANTTALHARLAARQVPHTYIRYTTRTYGGFRCDGGHDWACWNADLSQDLPLVLKAVRA
ncbi:alpha/beta hydrolase [Cutibacterium sp. V947]|uniref:alpha/beta hydrolase n=1 Tax=Cutibacterium sp. V947 TaxID=3446480 RepID=UPI003EDF65BF